MKLVYIILVLLLLAGCAEKNKDQDSSKQEAEQTKVDDQASDDQTETQTDKKENSDDQDEDQDTEAVEETVKIEYKVDPGTWSIVPLNDEVNKKVVLLTIDDAPDEHALDMAKTLKSLDVNAIFFINGIYVDTPEKAKVLKEIYDMGFLIGDHTYSHPYLNQLSEAEQKKEILSVYDRIEEVTGEPPSFFRAPFGENTDVSYQLAHVKGMTPMNWSFGYDWTKKYQTKEAITDIMINTPLLHSGSILLMHDRAWTAAALKDIVQGLQKKGYEMLDPNKIQTAKNQR